MLERLGSAREKIATLVQKERGLDCWLTLQARSLRALFYQILLLVIGTPRSLERNEKKRKKIHRCLFRLEYKYRMRGGGEKKRKKVQVLLFMKYFFSSGAVSTSATSPTECAFALLLLLLLVAPLC